MATKPQRGNVSNSNMHLNTGQSVDHHVHPCVCFIDSQKGGYGNKTAPGKCLELKHVSKPKVICGPPYACVCVLYKLSRNQVMETKLRPGNVSNSNMYLNTRQSVDHHMHACVYYINSQKRVLWRQRRAGEMSRTQTCI